MIINELADHNIVLILKTGTQSWTHYLGNPNIVLVNTIPYAGQL